jgi:hypothetical protein
MKCGRGSHLQKEGIIFESGWLLGKKDGGLRSDKEEHRKRTGRPRLRSGLNDGDTLLLGVSEKSRSSGESVVEDCQSETRTRPISSIPSLVSIAVAEGRTNQGPSKER